MMCRRCGGFMIVEPFHDDVPALTASEHEQEALGTRCVNCGNVEDAVIHTNRLEPPSRKQSARHYLGLKLATSPREQNGLVGDRTD